MTDIFSKEARSRIMRGAKSKDTQPEIRLRKALWAQGLRYRIHYKLPGSPDIAFLSKRIIIFVHGCYWHCCPWHGRMPTSNRIYWEKKLARNRQRDKKNWADLKKLGWNVITVWEHQVMEPSKLEKAVERIRRALVA